MRDAHAPNADGPRICRRGKLRPCFAAEIACGRRGDLGQKRGHGAGRLAAAQQVDPASFGGAGCKSAFMPHQPPLFPIEWRLGAVAGGANEIAARQARHDARIGAVAAAIADRHRVLDDVARDRRRRLIFRLRGREIRLCRVNGPRHGDRQGQCGGTLVLHACKIHGPAPSVKGGNSA